MYVSVLFLFVCTRCTIHYSVCNALSVSTSGSRAYVHTAWEEGAKSAAQKSGRPKRAANRW